MVEQVDAVDQDVPAGYKMTELGPLPDEWGVKRLGELMDSGARLRRADLSEGQVPFIPMSLIPEAGLYITRWEMREPTDVRSGVAVQAGDLLLAKITPCLENGKQGIVRGIPGGFAFATTEVIPIRPTLALDTEFLALYLKLSDVRQALTDKMEGTTGRQRLPKAVVESLHVPLPPLPEQRAIAHVLRTVQRAQEATEAVIAATHELKKSLMRHLFTYGPVPIDQADQVSLKETEIGLVPEEWKVAPLANGVTETQYGLSVRGERSGRYPILRMNCLSEGRVRLRDLQYVDLDDATFTRFRMRRGDLLFNRTNSTELVGKTGLFAHDGDFTFASYLVRVRPDYEKLVPEFLNYYLNTAEVQDRLRGVATRGVSQSNINATKLREIPIPLPSLAEQRQVALTLSTVDGELLASEQRKAALETLFKTLLRELMTGRLRTAL